VDNIKEVEMEKDEENSEVNPESHDAETLQKTKTVTNLNPSQPSSQDMRTKLMSKYGSYQMIWINKIRKITPQEITTGGEDKTQEAKGEIKEEQIDTNIIEESKSNEEEIKETINENLNIRKESDSKAEKSQNKNQEGSHEIDEMTVGGKIMDKKAGGHPKLSSERETAIPLKRFKTKEDDEKSEERISRQKPEMKEKLPPENDSSNNEEDKETKKQSLYEVLKFLFPVQKTLNCLFYFLIKITIFLTKIVI